MRKLLAAAWLFAASAILAGPITGPTEFKRDTVAAFDVKAKGDLGAVVPAGLSIQKAGEKWYVAGKPGTYRIVGTDFWVDFDAKKYGREPVDVTFKILPADGEVAPTPGPTPQPTPDPAVRTNPFSDETPRVLFLWNPHGDPLTADATSTMWGETARTAAKAFAGENYRVLTTLATPSEAALADAVKKGGKSYPWVKIGKGNVGIEGPVRTPAEFMAMLDEVKGPTPAPKAEPQTWSAGGVQFQAAPACRQVIVNGRLVTICP